MSYVLRDGTGGSYLAKVSPENRQHTVSITQSTQEQAGLDGRAYNLNTGDITLTDAADTPVMYLKNNEDCGPEQDCDSGFSPGQVAGQVISKPGRQRCQDWNQEIPVERCAARSDDDHNTNKPDNNRGPASNPDLLPQHWPCKRHNEDWA